MRGRRPAASRRTKARTGGRPNARRLRFPRGRGGKPRLALVGAGRAGAALALALARAGWSVVAVAARRAASARALARHFPGALATTDPSTAAQAADVLILAVPDRLLPLLARELATGPKERAGSARPGRRGIVLHTSGASDASVLAPLRARGWAVGSLHPLLSFPNPRASARPARGRRGAAPLLFAGAAVAVDGDPPARRLARRLARDLGAHPLAVPPSERARYHLAACFAANYVVTLVWEATRLLEEAGIPRGRTLPALLPLIRSTVANLEATGLPDALTGPVVRGDDVTLARHAALLRRGDPVRRALHRLLALRTARLARAARRLDPAALRRIARALSR